MIHFTRLTKLFVTGTIIGPLYEEKISNKIEGLKSRERKREINKRDADMPAKNYETNASLTD